MNATQNDVSASSPICMRYARKYNHATRTLEHDLTCFAMAAPQPVRLKEKRANMAIALPKIVNALSVTRKYHMTQLYGSCTKNSLWHLMVLLQCILTHLVEACNIHVQQPATTINNPMENIEIKNLIVRQWHFDYSADKTRGRYG